MTQRRRGAGDAGGAMTENELSGLIIDAAIEVHRVLGGPGLLESVYEEALAWELVSRGVEVVRQKTFPILYKGTGLGTPLRVDLLVGGKVLVECKSSVQHARVFEAQVLTYLRITGLKLGLLINFGAKKIEIKRFVY